MKKLINLFFLLLVLTTMSLISCSKNEIENDDYVIPGEDSELYKKVANELYDYLYTHENATIEDLQEQLTNYSTQITSEVISDILFVYIDSLTFVCDPYCKTGIQKQEGDNQAIIDFIKEMNDALYPEGALCRDSKMSDDFETSLQMGKTRGSRSSSTNNVLTKEKVMYWDPYNRSHVGVKWGASLSIREKNLTFDSFTGDDAKLSKLRNFDDYDVVFMCCHGGPDGNIFIPSKNKKSIFNMLFDRGEKKLKKFDLISVEELKKNLPSDMSKTVLWTAICWSDISHLKKIALERNCVAFSGPDNWCNTAVTDEPFVSFINAFYQPSSIYAAARLGLFEECEYLEREGNWVLKKGDGGQVSFGEGRTIRISMRYKNMHYTDPMHPEEGEKIVDGNYIVTIKDALTQTKNVIKPQESQNDQPRADITTTYNQFVSTFASREGTRATGESSNDGLSMGFWVRNKETKEETDIVISDSTVVIYANEDNPKYYPKDDNKSIEIIRAEVFGKTDNLAPGTYEYRTYLEIDGEKEYSDSIYEFTVMDIKHLSCPDFNHPHLIDLGLPSGTKWLCCNLGVDNLVNTGHYFAWGVTLPYDKNDYQLMHYPRFYYPYSECHGGSDLDLAYQWDGDIYTDIGNNISGTAYDAAYSKSNLIRMPTKEDFEELIESCAFLMGPVCISDGTSSNLLYSGSVAIGPNGNMIALPIANYWTGTLSKEEESGGALLAYPRVNGVSGSAYSFVGEDVNYTSVSLDESVKLLLHYIKDDEVDRNIYYFIGSKFYMPSIAPKKRFHPYYIRPVGR